jgi:hypothetical protein
LFDLGVVFYLRKVLFSNCSEGHFLPP